MLWSTRMNGFRMALLFVVSGLAGACGPHQDGDASLCDGTAAQPASCTQSCDPSPGAANTCPSGFHCSPDGTCDQECTAGGGQCSSEEHCSSDGTCLPDQGSNATAPDANCPALHFTATAITPSIELLVDQSGSMADPFSGDTGESKYQALHDALVGSDGVVTTLQTKAYFGATLFTTSDDNSVCPQLTTTPRALSNLPDVKAIIEANQPGNNTPTPQSILAVIADFAIHAPPAGSPPIIVLATDGLPNSCDGTTVETASSVAAASAAYAAGIRLFMLSVGDEVADAHAQAMANAGAGVTTGQPNAPSSRAPIPRRSRPRSRRSSAACFVRSHDRQPDQLRGSRERRRHARWRDADLRHGLDALGAEHHHADRLGVHDAEEHDEPGRQRDVPVRQRHPVAPDARQRATSGRTMRSARWPRS